MYVILCTFLNNLGCEYYPILWMRKMVPQRLVRVHKVSKCQDPSPSSLCALYIMWHGMGINLWSLVYSSPTGRI